MKKKLKQILSALLVAVMLIGIAPIAFGNFKASGIDNEEDFYLYLKKNNNIYESDSYAQGKNNCIFSVIVKDFDSDGIDEFITFNVSYDEKKYEEEYNDYGYAFIYLN